MVKIKDINKFLFVALLFFASVPYLGYGMSLIRNGYVLIGSYAQAKDAVAVYSGTVGTYFVYLKDIVCALLIVSLIISYFQETTKAVVYVIMVVTYGMMALMLDGNFSIIHVIGGIRTLMFVVATIIFCIYLQEEIGNSNFIYTCVRAMDLTLLLQIIVVFFQITNSNGWTRLGSGAYRYCGCFAGSGNLGCYTIGLILFYAICSELIDVPKSKGLYLRCFLLVFLSVASGTRTTIILTAIVTVYIIIYKMMKAGRFSYKSIIFTFFALVALLMVPAINILTEWIGRGNMMDSGGGRIELFSNMLQSSSIFEFLFGHGLGVGTNAAITMGATDTVSDSTINLIFTQYGIIGLLIFIGLIIFAIKNLYLYSSVNGGFKVLFTLVIIAMLVVGNLFEHIAMALLLVFTFYIAVYYREIVQNDDQDIGDVI